jgi:hypothetical protein
MSSTQAQIRQSLRPAFEEAEEAAMDSRRRQKAQDDLGAAHRRETQDIQGKAPQPGAANQGLLEKQWFAIRAGNGVAHKDDEIRISVDPRTGMTREQVSRAIDVALEKGWAELYVYNDKNQPDTKLAEAINKVIAERGLLDRLHCCTDPNKMCSCFEEMKRAARDPKFMATAVAATAAVGVAAAVAHHLSQS